MKSKFRVFTITSASSLELRLRLVFTGGDIPLIPDNSPLYALSNNRNLDGALKRVAVGPGSCVDLSIKNVHPIRSIGMQLSKPILHNQTRQKFLKIIILVVGLILFELLDIILLQITCWYSPLTRQLLRETDNKR